MAKKVVAKLQKKEGENFIRAVKMMKSEKTGAFIFKEKMIEKSKIAEFFNSK